MRQAEAAPGAQHIISTRQGTPQREARNLTLYIGYTVAEICSMISSGACPERLMSRSTRFTRSKCTPPCIDTRRSSSGLRAAAAGFRTSATLCLGLLRTEVTGRLWLQESERQMAVHKQAN